MPASLRANLRQILPLVKAKLVLDIAEITDSEVRFAIPNYVPEITTGSQHLFVMPGGATPTGDFFHGSGTLDRRIGRQLWVMIRTRLKIDSVGKNDRWLLSDPPLGHAAMEDKVIEALDEWFPTINQDELTHEPIEFMDVQPPRQHAEEDGWGESVVMFHVPHRKPYPNKGLL